MASADAGVDDEFQLKEPSPDGLHIGERLRSWRQDSKLTLADVAEAADLSIGYISQVERGMANPSLETLKRLATAVGRMVGDLFVDISLLPVVSRYSVTRKGERKQLRYPGSGILNELLSSDLRRRMEVIWVHAPVGATSGGHPHSHEGEECGLVLAGEMHLWVGEDELILAAGDSIYLESTLPHRWIAGGGEDLQAIWIVTPPTF